MYKFAIHFTSSHKLEVVVPDDKLTEFCDCLKTGAPFLDEKHEHGICVPKDKMLYYEVKKWDPLDDTGL